MKSIWTRVTAAALVVVMIVLFCGCVDNKNNSADNTTTTENLTTSASTIPEDETTTVSDKDYAQEDIREPEINDNDDEQGIIEISESEKRNNSIAILFYLQSITQRIKTEKNNRVCLEDIQASLYNDLSPSKIDSETLDYVRDLNSSINRFRMVDIKRERLQYLYNQDKAKMIRNAIPDPIAVLSATASFDWKRLVMGVTSTALSSYKNLQDAKDNADKQFLISGWELFDEEKNIIDYIRSESFDYLVIQANKNSLSDEQAPNEKTIERFVENLNRDNADKKILLEETQKDFGSYGPYWLELAKCYYADGQFDECINSVEEYRRLNISIFREKCNPEYANVLTMAISAAQAFDEEKRIEILKVYVDELEKSAPAENWALQYFLAETYLSLYGLTNDDSYIDKAYNTTVKNIIENCKPEQQKIDGVYRTEVKIETVDNSDLKKLGKTKKEQKAELKKLDEYNKSIKEKRKTELPSLYEPLVLNCALLRSLADSNYIGEKEKEKIKTILNNCFLVTPVANYYSFSSNENYSATFEKDTIIIPANLLTEDAKILVTVTATDRTEKTFDDWKVEKVKRPSKKESSYNDVSKYNVQLTSKSIKGYDWAEASKVKVTIDYGGFCDNLDLMYRVDYKKAFGPIPDKVVFKQTP